MRGPPLPISLETAFHKGNPYYTFDLNDGKAAIRIFSFGKSMKIQKDVTLSALAILLFSGLTCNVSSVRSETYRDIGPYDTLGDLKKMFPGATFTRVHPAWAQPSDVMYEIKGRGMSGTTIVKFYDPRPEYKKALEDALAERKMILDETLRDGAQLEADLAANRITDRDLNDRDRVALALYRRTKKTDDFQVIDREATLNAEERLLLGLPEADGFRVVANAPDDEISVEWVRWVPVVPIPLARFISKYGQPEKSGYSDEDLTPYRHWVKKGLQTFLSDDEKIVLHVDFQFTRADRRLAWRAKFPRAPIPKWLEEDPSEPQPQEMKPGAKRKAPK